MGTDGKNIRVMAIFEQGLCVDIGRLGPDCDLIVIGSPNGDTRVMDEAGARFDAGAKGCPQITQIFAD